MIDEKLVIAIKNTLSAAAAEILDDILKENAELKSKLNSIYGSTNDFKIEIETEQKLNILKNFVERLLNRSEPPCRENGFFSTVKITDIFYTYNEIKKEMELKEP
jgi:hypothetical protein